MWSTEVIIWLKKIAITVNKSEDYCICAEVNILRVWCVVSPFKKNKRNLLFWQSAFLVRVNVFSVCFLHEWELPALCSLPWWVAAQQGASETPLSRHFNQLLQGNPKAFPGQQKVLISTAFPRFALWSPPQRTCLKHLPREASRSYLNQMLSLLHWLLLMQRSTSSNLSFTHSLSNQRNKEPSVSVVSHIKKNWNVYICPM